MIFRHFFEAEPLADTTCTKQILQVFFLKPLFRDRKLPGLRHRQVQFYVVFPTFGWRGLVVVPVPVWWPTYRGVPGVPKGIFPVGLGGSFLLILGCLLGALLPWGRPCLRQNRQPLDVRAFKMSLMPKRLDGPEHWCGFQFAFR